MHAVKMRRLKKADCEVDFFFIDEVWFPARWSVDAIGYAGSVSTFFLILQRKRSSATPPRAFNFANKPPKIRGSQSSPLHFQIARGAAIPKNKELASCLASSPVTSFNLLTHSLAVTAEGTAWAVAWASAEAASPTVTALAMPVLVSA